MKKILILLILLSSCVCYGQEKVEFEKRISKEEVPLVITEAFHELEPELRKVRYYSERDGNRRSFEVKFKHKGNAYSVEFTPAGKLEDIEISRHQKDIDGKVFRRIKERLDSDYDRWKIDKIQFQYLPKINDRLFLKELIAGRIAQHNRLELVIWCKKGRSKKAFEMLFTPDGSFVSMREVVHSDHDFLSF